MPVNARAEIRLRHHTKGTAFMTKIVKCVFFVFLLGALFSAQGRAQTINAASCNQSDVQTALNSVTSDGTTVNIPAGTCAWTTTLTYTASHSMTILGAGSLTTTGGGDQTKITDNASPSAVLAIITTAGKTFRMAGITFQVGTGTRGFNGTVVIKGFSQSVRIDHVHFSNLSNLSLGFFDWVYGVVDHSIFDLTGVNNGVRVEHPKWNNGVNGDQSWSDLSYFGTNKAVYIETNTCNGSFANGSNGGWIDDADNGAHLVLRYNTMNNCYFQVHDQTVDNRGPRVFEVYNNDFEWTNSAAASSTTLTLRDGTGLVWGNTANHYAGFVSMWTDRTKNDLSWGSTPGSWGYCGTTFGPSAWDGTQDSSGYPCIDQIGRGKGDLITGLFPAKINSVTGTISWPHQAIEPVYEWGNSWSSPGYGSYWGAAGSNIQQNRDYYLYTASFNGTSGTGSGLLSARPSTCTAGPGGNTNGVAYWATDTKTLYVCNPTNTWTSYYTPYTYPHPLTGQTVSSGTAPGAPTNLTVTVQ
jgi:hypothetical protein